MARGRRHGVQYAECKTLGHAWDEYNPRDGGGGATRWRLTLRCSRCSTTRHDDLDARGEVVSRQYAYPDGYRDPVELKPSRAALRLMLVKR